MSSTGTSIVSFSAFFCAGVDDRDRPVADGAACGGELVVDLGVACGVVAVPRLAPALPASPRRAPAIAAVASTPPRKRATSSSGRCVADRPMRCGGRSQQRLEPLERQRQVRAALGRHQRVDLVDDDRVDRAQRLARVRRQQQVERLRRGDQDVGRLALEPRALGLRRVAGADRDRRRDGTRRRAPRRPARCRRAARAGCARRRPPAP